MCTAIALLFSEQLLCGRCLCLVQGLLLRSLHVLELDVLCCFRQRLVDVHNGCGRSNGVTFVFRTRRFSFLRRHRDFHIRTLNCGLGRLGL